MGDKHPTAPPHRACPTVPTTVSRAGDASPSPARHEGAGVHLLRQLAQKATSRLSRLPQSL